MNETNLPKDATIISGDNEEIQTNKYLLSLFSPTLNSLLSSLCCISPTILLPDCSTFSIKYLLNIITNGFTVTDGISKEESQEIVVAAELLCCDVSNISSEKVSGQTKVHWKNGENIHRNSSFFIQNKVKGHDLSDEEDNMKPVYSIKMNLYLML